MDKIPVAVLAATGAVGQRFIQLLADHPWFEITALAASERNVGKKYAEASNWVISGDPPPVLAEMAISPLDTTLPAKIVFSALPGSVAREFEPLFA
jgi:aspartate-semialdehyde dehydrogenase